MKRIFWFPCVLLLQAVLATSNELWPKLSCHEGYTHSYHEGYNHKECTSQTLFPEMPCYKACMQVMLGIIDPAKTNIQFSDPEYRHNRLAHVFQGGPKATEFATMIEGECRNRIDEINEYKKECQDWNGLYDCVQNTMGCLD